MNAPAYHPIPVEDFRLAGCDGKDRLDRQLAKQIVDRMSWARKSKMAPNAYRCDHCGHWHVGARSR
jgi:hypothetical protein